MKNIFFVDNAVGKSIAAWIIDNYNDDIGTFVVTSKSSDVYCYISAKNAPCIDVGEFKKQINVFDFDFGFLVWWPYIIDKQAINISKYGFINTHPSLLPYNRGKNYNFWAIIENAPFGTTLHFVDEKIDSGDIIAQAQINYSWEDTGKTLFEKSKQQTIELFIREYPNIRIGNYTRTPQDVKIGSFHYASEMNKKCVLQLDEQYTARNLLNLLRARTFEGFPACTFDDDGKTYEVRVFINEKQKNVV